MGQVSFRNYIFKSYYANTVMENNIGNANYIVSDCQTICWEIASALYSMIFILQMMAMNYTF